MTAEYNSSLISKLYKESDLDEIEKILSDMSDVGDAVFVLPIIDAFRKHKRTSISHYFISALADIKSDEMEKYLSDLLLECVDDKDTKNFMWTISVMNSQKIYTDFAIKVSIAYVNIYLDDQRRMELDLNNALNYLKNAKRLDDVRETLKSLLLSDLIKRDEKETIFKYLMDINPSEGFKYIASIYLEKIKDTDFEIILAKKLKYWKGGGVNKLRDLILKNGQGRAKEIIKQQIKEKEEKDKDVLSKTEEKNSHTYFNSEVVGKISDNRNQINILTQINKDFRFRLFPESELLIGQMRVASDEPALIAACIQLRTIIQKVDESVKNSELSEEEIKVILPDVDEKDRKKTLNQLFLFLKNKEVNVELDIFGIRDVNKFTSLVAHPEEKEELFKLMRKIGALEMYKNKEWAKIHNHILNLYNNGLELLRTEIEKLDRK